MAERRRRERYEEVSETKPYFPKLLNMVYSTDLYFVKGKKKSPLIFSVEYS